MSLVEEIQEMMRQSKERHAFALNAITPPPTVAAHQAGRIEALEDVLKLLTGSINGKIE